MDGSWESDKSKESAANSLDTESRSTFDRSNTNSGIEIMQISLLKDGAMSDIGDKFAANQVTDSMSKPIATSPGHSGFGPQLSLSTDSSPGNGIFGLSWPIGLPSITLKTSKGLLQYIDIIESDVVIRIQRYRPQIEGLFAQSGT